MIGGFWIPVHWTCFPILWIGGKVVDFVWLLWELRYGIAYLMLTTTFVVAVWHALTILYGCLT